MQLRGIRVDPLALEDQRRKLRRNLVKVEEMLKTIVAACWDRPWMLNTKKEATFPNSTKQLIEFFYDTMGLKRITQKQKGEVKTPMDREILERLSVQFQTRPIISLILAHRDITGSLEVLESQIDPDYRMRCSINIAATTTGRFSTSKSTTGSGRNLQNITEDLRKTFIADTGYKIAGIDKEQAESREVGYFCGVTFGDWSYLDAIESSDIHTYTCRLIWPNLPWTGDIKKDKEIANRPFYRHLTYRDMTKRCAHGSNYLGQPYTIALEIKVPTKFVTDFQTAYFRVFPCIKEMHLWVAAELQTKGYLINVFGRRRDFFDRPDSNETLKQAVAFLFQSATADDMNLGLWRIWKYIPDRAQLLLQLHDAIYFQFSIDDDEIDLIKTAQKLLDVELISGQRHFIVPTDPLTGFNLGHRYKLDEFGKPKEVNPMGLDKIGNPRKEISKIKSIPK
jgi:DNA polymerase I-like protein with 3'-5' exonuclease and polymerase domains